MDHRFTQLPRALAERAVLSRLANDQIEGGVPALLAHPDLGWNDPEGGVPTARPVVIWMHGRTVSKELDPGRYLRWLRAGEGGLATCAIDLPGHGERFHKQAQGSDATLDVVEKAANEIDHMIASLEEPRWRGAFDTSRMALGGMSAGGMVTLVRLCRPHRFRCAAVESTAGDFQQMAFHELFYTRGNRDPAGKLAQRLNPMTHLDGWRAIPLLALHSESDEWVPVSAIRSFITKLRDQPSAVGAESPCVELITWPETGAPNEHAGFGHVSNEAKNIQTAFLVRHLGG